MDGDESGRADGAVAAGTGVGCTVEGAEAGWAADPGASDPAADDPTADDPSTGDPSAGDDVVGANDEDGICGGIARTGIASPTCIDHSGRAADASSCCDAICTPVLIAVHCAFA